MFRTVDTDPTLTNSKKKNFWRLLLFKNHSFLLGNMDVVCLNQSYKTGWLNVDSIFTNAEVEGEAAKLSHLLGGIDNDNNNNKNNNNNNNDNNNNQLGRINNNNNNTCLGELKTGFPSET